MIIFNGNKYACASCIRGHRSSTCRHSHRMLIKVRTRGRPSPMAIRDAILVDSTSQSTEYENGAQIEGDCCSAMNQQPILFVRASAVRKARMINGKLHILMEEGFTAHEPKDISTFTDDGNKYITETEFLRNTLPKLRQQEQYLRTLPSHLLQVRRKSEAGFNRSLYDIFQTAVRKINHRTQLLMARRTRHRLMTYLRHTAPWNLRPLLTIFYKKTTIVLFLVRMTVQKHSPHKVQQRLLLLIQATLLRKLKS